MVEKRWTGIEVVGIDSRIIKYAEGLIAQRIPPVGIDFLGDNKMIFEERLMGHSPISTQTKSLNMTISCKLGSLAYHLAWL